MHSIKKKFTKAPPEQFTWMAVLEKIICIGTVGSPTLKEKNSRNEEHEMFITRSKSLRVFPDGDLLIETCFGLLIQ